MPEENNRAVAVGADEGNGDADTRLGGKQGVRPRKSS
jgi:hypothetical protein